MWIYAITNIVNGKQYVGQTIGTVATRFARHIRKSHHSPNMPISQAIQKYGKESFTVAVLCECITKAELDQKELDWANKLNTFSPNGYNLRAGQGRGSWAEEQKEVVRQRNLSRIVSIETRKRMSDAHTGKKSSIDTRLKISASKKGKKAAEVTYKRLAEAKAKTFEFISPDNRKVSITNLTAFCRENKLPKNRMFEVVYRKRNNYKGWKLT